MNILKRKKNTFEGFFFDLTIEVILFYTAIFFPYKEYNFILAFPYTVNDRWACSPVGKFLIRVQVWITTHLLLRAQKTLSAIEQKEGFL